MIKQRKFGKISNQHDVHAFDLTSSTGLSATVLNYGAIIQSLRLPSGRDIVLGFDELEGYLGPHPNLGTIIGRVANRIENAAFSIDGKTYRLPANEGAHNLHSGPDGFDRVLWDAKIDQNGIAQNGNNQDRLILTHSSPAGHQGFPGQLDVQIIFQTLGNTLRLDMSAHCDKACPVNLTHHSYFNLTDAGRSKISDHDLTVLCQEYLDMQADQIPSGRILPVSGTPYDFQTPKAAPPDLDDCFVKHHNAHGGAMQPLVRLRSKTTGTELIVSSTQPSVQIYSGAHIEPMIGKTDISYGPNHGIAIEPQNFPNAVNEDGFPCPILRAGETYHHRIDYTLNDARS